MALIEVRVPDIGDFDEVAVIELLVKPGDTVTADQSLITVESDKASMEIPSSATGVVQELRVKIGDKVKEGSVLLLLETSQSAVATATPSATPKNGSVAATVAAVSAASVAPTPAPGLGSVLVLVPDIGDFKDVAVIELLVKVGDTIAADQSLMTVESDKASMEIPSSAAGVVKEIKVKLGDTVNIGDALLVLEGAAASTPTTTANVQPAATAAAPVPAAPKSGAAEVLAITPTTTQSPVHAPIAIPVLGLPYASPSVRKFARELGVPLAEVKGSGEKGRITQADVQKFTSAVMAGAAQTQAQTAQTGSSRGADAGGGLGLLAWPKVDFAKFGAIERRDLSRIKKISGANLHRNWVLIPHVTNHDDADITDLEALRVQLNAENAKSGVKVTMLAFLIKACVAALKKFPEFNASLDGEQIVYKKYFHIGFAADTPNGLMVPVIKDADTKGIFQISKEMGELAAKAREGKLSPAEMTGGCFSISSLGGIGGRYFTPIINAPEVAILGVCKSQTEAVWNGSEFVPRLMLPLSLSWDHRVIDGAAAARFNAYLGQVLADFRRILL